MTTIAELKNMWWLADWVATPAQGDPRFSVSYFRRRFDLADAKKAKLIVHVSADSRYRFFVNGSLVGRGPCRGDLDHYNFETYDLSAHLRPGKNVLAAQVMSYATYGPFPEIHDIQGGFTLQGTLTAKGGATVLNTGAEWRVLADAAYSARYYSGRHAFFVNPMELVRGAAFPWGWQAIGYDDSAWAIPRVIGPAVGRNQWRGGTRHNWRLVPREIAFLGEERRYPEAVITAPQSDQLDRLLKPGGSEPVTVGPHSAAEWTIYMGRHFTGYPTLTTSGGAGAEIELMYAEALEKNGEKGRRDDLTFGKVDGPSDVYLPGGHEGETWQPIHWRCGRFIKVRVKTAGEALRLKSLDFDFTSYPFQERGSFDSNDPELKRIWDLSWHTALCCAHEHYEDCPFYEQLQYVSDTRLQILISYNVAGDDSLAQACIRTFDHSRLNDGITQSRFPSRVQQIIPPFALFYVMMVEDHWQYYADKGLVSEVYPTVDTILEWFQQHMTPEGVLGRLPWWNFTDWCFAEWEHGVPPEAQTGACTIINLELVAALQSAARLHEALGNAKTAVTYTQRAAKLQKAVRRTMWNEKEGLYADGPGSKNLSQHANIWAILSDTATKAQTASIMKRLVDDPKLIRGTYIYDYYLFQALLKVGAYDRLEGVIQRWREMLHYGLSTCPENPEPTRSDCHAWSAWPMFEFQRVLLGVRPGSPGYGFAEITPRPFGTVTEARGQVTTCRGNISVAWKMEGDRFGLKALLPKGMKARIELPTGVVKQIKTGGEVSLGDKKITAKLVLKTGRK